MNDRVYCTTVLEPKATYGRPVAPPGSLRVVAVHLNFDVVEQVAPREPERRFKAFLKALPSAVFYAYALNPTGDLELVNSTHLALTTKGTPSANRVDEIMRWIKQQVGGPSVSGGRWIGTEPTAGGVYAAHQLDASKVLSSAALWDAPLPQNAGLVRAVELKANSAAFGFENILLLPFFNGVAAPATILKTAIASPETDELDVAYDAGLPVGSTVVCRVRFISEPKMDPSSLVDEDLGFLRVNQEALLIHNSLQQVRNKSGSLFLPLSALLALEWRAPKGNSPQPSSVKRLIWRAMNGLGALLEPLLLSLTMPPGTSEGPFIAALIGEILKKVPEASPEKIQNFVRTSVTRLIPPRPPEGNASERGQVAIGLRKLFRDDLSAENLVATLLNLYISPGPAAVQESDLLGDRRESALDRQLCSELGDLATAIHSEAGLEKLFRKLFEEADITPGALHADGAVGTVADWEAAFAAFYNFLDSSLNALDATRHAQASLYESALVRKAKAEAEASGLPSSQWTHDILVHTAGEADWFAKRFTGDNSGAFGPIVDVCPLYARPALDSTDVAAVQAEMAALYQETLTSILGVGKPSRFLPDHSPRPLPIQISVDADTADLDNFVDRYTGLSILIERADSDWAYANLAELTLAGNSRPIDEVTIHPLQSVSIDGQRQLFVEFNGVPFASSAVAEFAPPQDDAADAAHPFFTVDAPAQVAPKAKLPSLAYGMNYRVSTHILSRSGSLPLTLQKMSAEPWLPADTINLASLPAGYVQEQTCLRTTAVGRTLINETTKGVAPRIGVNIDGVYPLFGDFPRIGVAATEGRGAALDVLRNTDGTGAFTLPIEGEHATLELTDMMWWGGSGRLVVELFRQPNPKPGEQADLKWTFEISNAFQDERAEIHLIGEKTHWMVSAKGPAGAIIVGDPRPIPAPDGLEDQSCWLRLTVRAVSRTKSVSLSLRDPSQGFRSDHAGTVTRRDNLLLLAPTTNLAPSEWLPKYEKDVAGEIVFPKVTYEDFDRWYNNPSARPNRTSEGPAYRKLEKARQALLAGSLARTVNDGLSKLIDALPDPAVDKILIELTPLDGLTKAPTQMVVDENYAATSRILNLAAIYDRPLPDVDNTPKLVTDLANLARHHSADVIISSDGAKLAVTAITPAAVAQPPRVDPEFHLKVNVPRGLVAQLTVRPLLSAAKAAFFDPRVAELAAEKRTIDGVDYFVMEGTSLIIESMLGVLAAAAPKADEFWLSTFTKQTNDWADLVSDSITVMEAGRQRRYEVAVQPRKILSKPNSWRWRQLGSIDIQTQRWRHTGRPIYSWFDPKAGRTPPVNTPAVALRNDHPGLASFIGDAFFDRDDEDADVQTARLNVFPEATRLQAFPWESPSATLFRHRITVRSRYAGALRLGSISEVPSWRTPPDDRKFETWTHVAMLADQTRLQLTRPRLRALIPLTQSPDVWSPAGVNTPPIMAVLDEAPFFHGGLADRIGSEIKTGFGYEMGANSVGLLDSRKEVGPDPRLSYSAMIAAKALAMSLSTEGPVGLTFDTVSVRTPAFANTALVLAPVHLGDDTAAIVDLEEHFLSVALRRYLDHRWIVDHGDIPHDLSCNEPWWIELKQPQNLDCASRRICKLELQNGDFTVSFCSDLLYSGGENSQPFVPVCQASQSHVEALVFQYLPLEAGRASISIFALPKDDGYLGSNLPVMLATVEWALPTGASSLEFDGVVEVHRTSSSPTTSMNWSRTGRNFELVSSFDDQDDTNLLRHPVSEITVKEINGAYRFATKTGARPLALEASLNTAPNPLYIHRHLAVVKSLFVQSAGRNVEIYDKASRLLGSHIPITSGNGSIRVVEFETPAAPVCWNLPVAAVGLDQFKVARFDLFSILGAKFADDESKAPVGVSVFVRPLAGTDGNRRITSLSFRLSAPPLRAGIVASVAGMFTVTLPSGVNSTLRGIVLQILGHARNSPAPATVTAKAVYAGGETRDATVSILTPFEFCLLDSASIDLSFDAIVGLGGNTEFWADMSMLTLPRAGTSSAVSFSFDWFFSGGEMEVGEAVSPRGLAGMVETQARIISVSSPIPIDA